MSDPLQRASVSLLVHGDELSPDEVTTLLGCQPDIAARKGEAFVGHNGMSVTASTGKWIVGTGYRQPPCIDEQIRELLNRLPHELQVWDKLTTQFECYVTVGVYFSDWTGGITLEPTTLSMLATRSLPLDFDMYAPNSSK